MTVFTRDDGATLRVVEGFRQRALSRRCSVTPRPEWDDQSYAWAAKKKRQRAERLRCEIENRYGSLRLARVLDVGCGDGLNCLLLAKSEVRSVVGIDLHLPLFAADQKGQRTRRLASMAVAAANGDSVLSVLAGLPVELLEMDATRMAFPDGHFDIVFTRSAMEHFFPVERALREMVRVLRPGGILYVSIDSYYWLRGCHKRGVVDIPWAHARLTLDEYRRFVADREGPSVAEERCRRLTSLNQFSHRQWREVLQTATCEISEWKTESSPLAEELLGEHPEVATSLLPGVEPYDLTHAQLHAWLRN